MIDPLIVILAYTTVGGLVSTWLAWGMQDTRNPRFGSVILLLSYLLWPIYLVGIPIMAIRDHRKRRSALVSISKAYGLPQPIWPTTGWYWPGAWKGVTLALKRTKGGAHFQSSWKLHHKGLELPFPALLPGTASKPDAHQQAAIYAKRWGCAIVVE